MLTPDAIGQFGRRIEIAMTANNFDLARVIVTEAERTSTATPEVVTINDPISCLGVSSRVTNALERAGFVSIKQVLNASRDRLLEINGINATSLGEIMAAARLLVGQ